MSNSTNDIVSNMVFFGTPQISVFVLEELEKEGILPSLVVTTSDKKRGRKMLLTPPETKVWAQEHNIPVLQTEKITEAFIHTLKDLAPKEAEKENWDIFVVAAYGKLLPQELLDIPEHGVVNVHPSLLPRLRGANPIRGAILADEKEVGVSIMLVDAEMDHGPILAQEKVTLPENNLENNKGWPPHGSELDEILARHGGMLLAHTLPQWIKGNITPQEQNHNDATFTKKITKEDGLIDIDADPYQNLLKIRAYEGWPGTYFFKDDKPARLASESVAGKRIKIIEAEIEDGKLKITRVIPEGKKEMDYNVFLGS